MTIIVMLSFPMIGIKEYDFTLQERMQSIAQPTQFWNGFGKREWQPFLEQSFLSHIGSFRSFLILSYNEAKHRLFPTRPNDHYIWTPKFGYYPVDTIRRLNGDVSHHDVIKQHYQHAAHRVRILQELLGHYGVSLLVVLPPPKVRVYPEYATPYLIAPAETIVSQAISYGDVLEESGVNVFNVQRIFTQKKAVSPWPFFTTTSFHWSFWAGCTVTDEILRKAEELTGRPFYSIDCSEVDYGKSKWTDMDIALILNIFSTDTIVGEAPFPTITPQQSHGEESPKIAIIGDSFSDQIVYALSHALPEMRWSPSWLTRYDSFTSRQPMGMGSKAAAQTPIQPDKALSEILTKELLIMEISDGSIYRDADDLNQMEFGATQILLDGLLTKAEAGEIDPKNFLVQGWRALDNKKWLTTGYSASFSIRPPTNCKGIRLMLDVENLAPYQRKPRRLDVLWDGKSIGQVVIAQGRGMLDLTIPSTAQRASQWQDLLVSEISLRDPSGQPLDLLLYGVQMIGANTDKKETAAEVLPMPQIQDHTGARTINLISSEEPEDILVEGLSSLESNDKESWRWALGPATRIKFYVDSGSDQARQRLLKFAFKNGVPIPGQTVTLRLNGKDVRHFSSEEMDKHELTDAEVMLAARQGVNELEIVYQDWNHGKKNYGSNDPRLLAVVLMRLSLQEVNK
jgi:hypothetical protein